MEQKLHLLLNKFEYARTLFCHNDPLCKHEVQLLERRTVDWGISFAVLLPEVKPLPKMHLMMHNSEFATVKDQRSSLLVWLPSVLWRAVTRILTR